MNQIYIKKNIIFYAIFFSYSIVLGLDHPMYSHRKYAQEYRAYENDQYSNIVLTCLTCVLFGISVYLYIYKPYKQRKIRNTIKNMMMNHKAYISDLFYKYPGIISLYANSQSILYANNESIGNMNGEVIEIKKVFYSIIYEIMRLIKSDRYFEHLNKQLTNEKILLEFLIQDIILNEPFFMQEII